MAVLGAVAAPKPRDTAISPEPGNARRKRVLYLSPSAEDLAVADAAADIHASVESWDEFNALAGLCAAAGISVKPSLHAAELVPYPDGFFDLICARDPGLVVRAAPELARALARGGEVRVHVSDGSDEVVRRALAGLEVTGAREPDGGGTAVLSARHPVAGESGAADPPQRRGTRNPELPG